MFGLYHQPPPSDWRRKLNAAGFIISDLPIELLVYPVPVSKQRARREGYVSLTGTYVPGDKPEATT